jgi:tryptophan synthase alpha chain
MNDNHDPLTDVAQPRSALRARLAAGAAQRPILTCYFPVGDPQLSPDLLAIYADEGVDVLELGLPSANPYLDGPDVAHSMARSGDWRRGLDAVRDHLARLARRPASLIMTYADLAGELAGEAAPWQDIDALLVVAPPDDPARASLEAAARRRAVLISSFTAVPFDAMSLAAARTADGYVMLQSTPGVTGPRDSLDPASRERLDALKRSGVTAPILLGFGISGGRQAAAARDFGADGVVVGSQCLRAALAGPRQLRATLADLRRGLDG